MGANRVYPSNAFSTSSDEGRMGGDIVGHASASVGGTVVREYAVRKGRCVIGCLGRKFRPYHGIDPAAFSCGISGECAVADCGTGLG